MEESACRSLNRQPPDGLPLTNFRCAAFNQRIELGTQTPSPDYWNGIVLREFHGKLVSSLVGKDGMRIEQVFILQLAELLEELIALRASQVR